MSITVQKFVDGYKKATDDKKAEFVQKHIIHTYMPYEEKVAKCKQIVNTTCFTTYPDGHGGNRQLFKLSSPTRYMLYVLMIISYYLDIDIRMDTSVLDDFNVLDRYDLIEVIFQQLPEREITKLNTVMNMVVDDTIENEHSIASLLETKFGAFESVIRSALNINDDITINEDIASVE